MSFYTASLRLRSQIPLRLRSQICLTRNLLKPMLLFGLGHRNQKHSPRKNEQVCPCFLGFLAKRLLDRFTFTKEGNRAVYDRAQISQSLGSQEAGKQVVGKSI